VSARALLGRYIHRLHGRIAVSDPAREFVSRFFPGEYRVIPNGVDVRRFNPSVLPLPEFQDGKLNILYLGRLEQRKGAKYLLRAIPFIREHFPDTRFIIAGDGKLRPKFEQYVAEKGWRDVHFLGRVPAERLPALYRSAHVFCAPNTGGESQGVVLLEALASGAPVVASDIAGFRSVIRNRLDGLLVPPKQHEELAWAVSYLLGDAAARRRLAEAGPVRAQDFSWHQVGARVEAYYQELYAQMGAARRSFILPSSTPSTPLPVGEG